YADHRILHSFPTRRSSDLQVTFYDEFQVIDLIVSEGRCAGVVAYAIATGEIHLFRAKAVLFATGGFGRIWSVTSNAYAFTGDGRSEEHTSELQSRENIVCR